MWRDFTCLEWTDWSMFWVGVSAAVGVMGMGLVGLTALFAYFDRTASYPRKPDQS